MTDQEINREIATEKTGEKCEWKYDDLDCFYETECGEAYCFTDGDREQNKYRHCPNCGKEICERK